MEPIDTRKIFSGGNAARIDFGQLPEEFEFVPETFIHFNDRIGLYVSNRRGFGVSLEQPDSLRHRAGLCFVSGKVQPNLRKAFDQIRRMLLHQRASIAGAQVLMQPSMLLLADVVEKTMISAGTIVHDGEIAIKIETVGVQCTFVLDGFETAVGCVPIGTSVSRKQWNAIFENMLSSWDRVSRNRQ